LVLVAHHVGVDDSDRSVLEQIAALYASTGGALWRAMLAVAGGRADVADDATAEAFRQLCCHWPQVRDPVPWLYRTAYNAVLQHLRRERRESPSDFEELDGVSVQSLLSADTVGLLRGLPPDQRLAVFLIYFADLSYAEAGRLTGSSAVAVRVRVHRARRKLRVLIEEASLA
jgi:RNA polymerase sigma factor (sigma-70 family)